MIDKGSSNLGFRIKEGSKPKEGKDKRMLKGKDRRGFECKISRKKGNKDREFRKTGDKKKKESV